MHQEALPCPAAGTQPPVSLWPSGGPCLLSESDDFLIARGLLSGLFEMALPHGPCSALSALSLSRREGPTLTEKFGLLNINMGKGQKKKIPEDS